MAKRAHMLSCPAKQWSNIVHTIQMYVHIRIVPTLFDTIVADFTLSDQYNI